MAEHERRSFYRKQASTADTEPHVGSRGQKVTAEYGSLSPPTSSGIPVLCWCILGVEFCERLAFYTITGSQAFFLEHIGFSLANAGALNATMWTLCAFLAVVASWIADVLLGRFWTILASGQLYIAGAALAALSAVPGSENSRMYFVAVMGLVPLATSGIKANISNFGADQYDVTDPAQVVAQERFFSVFYCTINMGAALAFGFFTTFATSGGLGLPKHWGYAVVYLSVGLCMLVAVTIFFLARRAYKVHPLLRRSSLAVVARCLFDAAASNSPQAMTVLLGLGSLLLSIFLSTFNVLMMDGSDPLTVFSFGFALLGTIGVVMPCMRRDILVAPRASPSREQEEVTVFLNLIPVLFSGSISFNALYNCMQFWYAQQACQMDVRLPVGFGGYQLSGSFFNIADCLGIVLFTPVVVFWIDPLLKTAWPQYGHREKFAIGMVIAGLSVMIAARLEVIRRFAPVLQETSNCAPPGVGMSDMSGGWMMFPFALMGLAEIYTQPTLMHYSYTRSPPSMRTLAVAMSFFIAAVSSSFFALLVNVLSPYMPNNLNLGHLEYGYYVNLVIGAIGLFVFLSVLSPERNSR